MFLVSCCRPIASFQTKAQQRAGREGLGGHRCSRKICRVPCFPLISSWSVYFRHGNLLELMTYVSFIFQLDFFWRHLELLQLKVSLLVYVARSTCISISSFFSSTRCFDSSMAYCQADDKSLLSYCSTKLLEQGAVWPTTCVGTNDVLIPTPHQS